MELWSSTPICSASNDRQTSYEFKKKKNKWYVFLNKAKDLPSLLIKKVVSEVLQTECVVTPSLLNKSESIEQNKGSMDEIGRAHV